MDETRRRRGDEEALARHDAIMALRQLNLNPQRPDSAYLRTLDTSSRKTAELLQDLERMDKEELEKTLDDLRGVNVRTSEAVYAICKAVIMSSNVQAAAQICSLLHQRHKEFSPCLKQSFLKVFSPGNADWFKKSKILLLLLVLYYVGVIRDCDIFVNVIKDITSVERLRDRASIPLYVPMLIDFAEHGRFFLGLPFSGQYEDFFKGLDVTEELKNSCKMAFKTYYTALADLLQCENELLVQMDKDSAKLELSGDNASSHEQLKKLCSDLYYFLSILAELLDLQPPAKDGTITESVDMQPRAKDFTTWLAEVWPNHFIPIDLRPSVQADVLGEAAHTSDEQSAKEKDNTSEAYTVPLPFDVMRKILSRCEVEDLVRFRTVNKEINAYNYKLLMHQALEFFIRVDNNHTVQIMNPGTRVLRELETPEDFRGAGAVSSMVHCKGLVLCSFMDAKLAIWNPVLIKARWINPPSGGFTNFDFYGLGYNEPSPDSYKVLRFIHRAQFQNSHFSGDDIQQAEIYEFGTDSWKTVEAKRDWIIESWSKGLSINGRMYWVAWKRLQESSKPVAFILSFDFSTEEFKSIVDCPNNGKGTLRLGSCRGWIRPSHKARGIGRPGPS